MEKFIIVSSDHGRTHKCNFSVFDRKFPVWANLVKKYQNCQFKLKCGNLNTQNGDVLFLTGIPLLGKPGPKNQNCEFKLKFSI